MENMNLYDKITEALDAVDSAQMYAKEWQKEAQKRMGVVRQLCKAQTAIDPKFDSKAFIANYTLSKATKPDAPPAEETAPNAAEETLEHLIAVDAPETTPAE